MPGRRKKTPQGRPTRYKPTPPEVTQMPMVRCGECRQEIYYDKRRTTAQKVMQKHYEEKHL
jgi:hypothetical protein